MHLWHTEWEVHYLVMYDKKADTCICLKCNKKIDTVKKKYSQCLHRHCESAHADTKDWSTAKQRLIVQQAKHKLKPM